MRAARRHLRGPWHLCHSRRQQRQVRAATRDLVASRVGSSLALAAALALAAPIVALAAAILAQPAAAITLAAPTVAQPAPALAQPATALAQHAAALAIAATTLALAAAPRRALRHLLRPPTLLYRGLCHLVAAATYAATVVTAASAGTVAAAATTVKSGNTDVHSCVCVCVCVGGWVWARLANSVPLLQRCTCTARSTYAALSV